MRTGIKRYVCESFTHIARKTSMGSEESASRHEAETIIRHYHLQIAKSTAVERFRGLADSACCDARSALTQGCPTTPKCWELYLPSRKFTLTPPMTRFKRAARGCCVCVHPSTSPSCFSFFCCVAPPSLVPISWRCRSLSPTPTAQR